MLKGTFDSGSLVPVLAVLVFLVSLRSDPGQVLFGEEEYAGELRGWGVLIRVFALAALQNFEHLWTAVAYIGVCAMLEPSSQFAELTEFALFCLLVLFSTNYRTLLTNVSASIVVVASDALAFAIRRRTNPLLKPPLSYWNLRVEDKSNASYGYPQVLKREDEEFIRVGRIERTPARSGNRSFLRSKSPGIISSKKPIEAEETTRVVSGQKPILPPPTREQSPPPKPINTSKLAENKFETQPPTTPSSARTNKSADKEDTRRTLNFNQEEGIATRSSTKQKSPTSDTKAPKGKVEDVKTQMRLEQQRRTEERLQKIKLSKKN